MHVNVIPYPFHSQLLNPDVIYDTVDNANKCYIVVLAHGHAALITGDASMITPNLTEVSGPITIIEEYVPVGKIYLHNRKWYIDAGIEYSKKGKDPVRLGSLRDHHQWLIKQASNSSDFHRARHQYIMKVENELLKNGPRHDTIFGRYYFDTAIKEIDLTLLTELGNNHFIISEDSAFGTVYLSRLIPSEHQIIYKYQIVPSNDKYANQVIYNEVENSTIINSILDQYPAAPFPWTYRIERCTISREFVKHLTHYECNVDQKPNAFVLVQQGIEHVGSLESNLQIEFIPELILESLTTLDFTHQIAQITHLDAHFQNFLVVECQKTDLTCTPGTVLRYKTSNGFRTIGRRKWKVYLIDFGQSCSAGSSSSICLSLDLEPKKGIVNNTTLTTKVAPAIDFITLMRGVWSIYFHHPMYTDTRKMMREWFRLYVALTAKNILGLALQVYNNQPNVIYTEQQLETRGSDVEWDGDYSHLTRLSVPQLAEWIVSLQIRPQLVYHLCRLSDAFFDRGFDSHRSVLGLLSGWVQHLNTWYRAIHQYYLQKPTDEVLEMFNWSDNRAVKQRAQQWGNDNFYIDDYIWLLEHID